MADLRESPDWGVIYVRVPASLRRRVRQEAANEDLSISQVVTNALQCYFDLPKGAAPRRRRKLVP